ncbi:MAG TPA: hypothetical protein VM735_03805, partial [Candidatus Kapabacteria bacterium]|nr:hypothetical protein [Candidatus Kapabacteria bacterium]
MLKLIPCITLLLLIFTSACSKGPETLVRDGFDGAAMDAAIDRARSEVDEFLKVLAAKDADS